MKENNSSYAEDSINEDNQVKMSYKPYTFSKNDKLERIRDLVIQMSHLPLTEREQNDSQR
jgi:hypothetical protein